VDDFVTVAHHPVYQITVHFYFGFNGAGMVPGTLFILPFIVYI
jgi:hypothetical protein